MSRDLATTDHRAESLGIRVSLDEPSLSHDRPAQDLLPAGPSRRVKRERLLYTTIALIDGHRPPSERDLAAEEWLSWVEDGDWPWVEGVLLACPAPDGTDYDGAIRRAGRLQGTRLREIASLQPRIRAVCEAWAALPPELLAGEDPTTLRRQAVHAGAFRSLVRGDPFPASSPHASRVAWVRDRAAAPDPTTLPPVETPPPSRLTLDPTRGGDQHATPAMREWYESYARGEENPSAPDPAGRAA